ncbi:uncharacterized protein LOC130443715 [Diorhabda sublineata]|uniref:uncharacterized protein LOC130443715 n=1 Tax=Diorhabda sublineata TaxID=1163346 RepID=UPI0024E0490A|nr:uncharacterized protein LOC130443715 [Diorhabda sublineata]XP_056634449.1 uncharacterized protein LOC130443715 [Diorhabda sublineata]XP_056634450.1 uncharacterized protein LOC130443715 [Diorhabda sublineata]XP_056634451.1 uncharacterized protein LOC130443715 [Diorhabda sublineata]
MVSKETVKCWLSKIFESINFEKYEIKIKRNDKASGYMSSIIFVTIQNGSTSTIDLVIKKSSDVKSIRETVEVRKFFFREIFMYETIFPIFAKLEKDKIVDEKFDSYPKYLNSLILDDTEIILMENLAKSGYKMWNRKINMDMNHCKIVLKAYAKLHSLSFALKDQNRTVYNSVTSNVEDLLKNWISFPSLKDYINGHKDAVLKTLQDHGDSLLSEFYKEELDDIYNVTKRILNINEDQVVFTHDDNWNNNYLFKYKDSCDHPIAVSIIDWQMSSLRSPIFDVSKFLYSVCSKKELDRLEDLLRYYYFCFAEHLTNLGSCPENLFSFSDFQRHWKTFSLFGIIGSTMVMKITLLDEDEAPSINELENGKNFNEVFNVSMSADELYYRRVRDVVSAYFEMTINPNFLK